MKKYSMEDPVVVRNLRYFYIGCQGAAILFYLFLRLLIQRKNDQRRFRYTAPAKPFAEAASDVPAEITYKDYDLSEANRMIQSTVTSMIFSLFLHFKFNFVRPLAFQSIPAIKQALESNIAKVYLFGNSKLARPFVVPNMFESLMRMVSPGAAAPEPAQQEAVVEDVTEAESSSPKKAPSKKED